MKHFWVKAIPWNKNVVTTALESGADAVLVPKGYSSQVKSFGKIKTIAEDGDIKLGKDVIEFEINNKADEIEAARLSKSKHLIVKTRNWKIIPLENLIAQGGGLVPEVKNSTEAKTALQILEKGADGILLNTADFNEIKKTAEIMRKTVMKIKLETAKITNVKALSMGDRVCLDTCTNMKIGQGMLVGNSSSAMFLVNSETVESQYVASRPFRVNAGAVHAYTIVADGKTKYLSELKSGDELLIVDCKGRTDIAILGRSKIEKRPVLLVEAKCGKKKVSLILQNAETIRLVTPKGTPVSVVELKKGSEVLAYVEEEARHFGMKIKETIVEK